MNKLESIRMSAAMGAFGCWIILLGLILFGTPRVNDIAVAPIFMFMCLFAAIAVAILVWYIAPMVIILFGITFMFVMVLQLQEGDLVIRAMKEVGTALYQLVDLIKVPAPGSNP